MATDIPMGASAGTTDMSTEATATAIGAMYMAIQDSTEAITATTGPLITGTMRPGTMTLVITAITAAPTTAASPLPSAAAATVIAATTAAATVEVFPAAAEDSEAVSRVAATAAAGKGGSLRERGHLARPDRVPAGQPGLGEENSSETEKRRFT